MRALVISIIFALTSCGLSKQSKNGVVLEKPVYVKFADNFNNNLLTIKINNQVLVDKEPFLKGGVQINGIYDKYIIIENNLGKFIYRGTQESSIPFNLKESTFSLSIQVDSKNAKEYLVDYKKGNLVMVSYNNGELGFRQDFSL